MKRSLRQFAATDAAEVAEAALVLPLVFMFLLGIVWFGRAFNTYSTIQQAAQQGAIIAARATCATCGDTQAAPLVAASAVTSVMQASSLDPTQIVNPGSTAPCPAPSNITVCQEVLLNLSNPNQVESCGTPPEPSPSRICGAIVTFQYPYQFYFPYTSLNLSRIILTAEAQSRMEN